MTGVCVMRTAITFKNVMLAAPLILTVLLILPHSAIALNNAELTGTYEGHVEFANVQPKIILCFDCEKDGSLKGKISLPDQNQHDMPVTNIKIEGNTVCFELSSGRATACFEGVYSVQDHTIIGKLTQAGQAFPFELKCQDKKRAMKVK